MMSKLQLELIQKKSTQEMEMKKHDTRHVMVQTENDDQYDEVFIKILIHTYI